MVLKQLSILLPVVKKTRCGIWAKSSDSDSIFAYFFFEPRQIFSLSFFPASFLAFEGENGRLGRDYVDIQSKTNKQIPPRLKVSSKLPDIRKEACLEAWHRDSKCQDGGTYSSLGWSALHTGCPLEKTAGSLVPGAPSQPCLFPLITAGTWKTWQPICKMEMSDS